MIVNERGTFKLKNSDSEYAFAGSLIIFDNGEIALTPDNDTAQPTSLESMDLEDWIVTGVLVETGRYMFMTGIIRNIEDLLPLRYVYAAEYCVISNDRIEKNSFRSIELPMDNLKNWHTPGTVSAEGDRNTSMIFNATVYDNHSWSLGEIDLELINFIGHSVNYNFSNSKFSAETKSVFKIYNGNEKPINELFKLSTKLEELISLLANGFFSFEKRFIHWDNDGGISSGELFFKKSNNSVHISVAKMMVRFNEVSQEFGDIFNNWLKESEELGPGIHLYTGTQRNKNLYIEHQFASLVWGLESLDRRLNNEDEAPQTLEYKKKLDYYLGKIFAKENDKYILPLNKVERSKVKGILEDKFSLTLSDRLYNLFKPICIEIDNTRLIKFCEKIANLRNNLSHEGGIKKNGDYGTFIDDLSKYKPALMELYGLVLLKILGLNEEIIEKYLFNERRVNHMVRKLQLAGLISLEEFEEIKQNAFKNRK